MFSKIYYDKLYFCQNKFVCKKYNHLWDNAED
ncbi:MAG: hypothetical protein KatS3mg033_2018 [Thermonema sp.]|jgi:hypothetical protein|nr:MAG: hypothetical protein KatS3mg033_2018 [Thermonema sp.]